MLCGGCDNYLKPLRFFFSWLRDAGHDVVDFEGSGQTGARFDIGLGTYGDHPMARHAKANGATRFKTWPLELIRWPVNRPRPRC